MKRVNILPAEIAAEFGYKSEWVYLLRKYFLQCLAGILIAEIALFGFIHVLREVRIGVRNIRLTRIKRDITALIEKSDKEEEIVSRIEREIDNIDERMREDKGTQAFLEDFRRKPKDNSRILAEINMQSPRQMWITYLSLKGRELKITGGSYNNLLVTRFMGNLKHSPLFSDIDFTYTKKGEIEGTEIVEFEIKCAAKRR